MTGNLNRFMLSRRSLILSGATASLAGMTGLFPHQAFAQTEPKKGGILRVIHYQNPSSLDPVTGLAGSDYQVLFTLYDRLIDFDAATLEAKPGLAESWDNSAPLKFVLKLRSGVTFHDGTAFDGEAVRFNIDRARSHPRSSFKSDLAAVDSVNVDGPLQVTLNLKYADASLLLNLSDRAGMMVSPTAAQAAGDDFDRNPVGAGAYKFKSWADSERVEVTRYDGYWRKDDTYLDGINFRIITDLTTGVRSFLAGEADFLIRVPTQQLRILKAKSDVVVGDVPSLPLQMIYLNYGKPPLDDIRVRQAMNLAIDRKGYSMIATGGEGELAWDLMPALHWAHNKAVDNAYTHDPDRARKLLADAGATNVEIALFGWSDQLSQQKAEIIIDQLAQIGMKVKLTVGQVTEMATRYFANEGNAFLSRWTGRPDPSRSYQYLFSKTGAYNVSKAETPEFGQLLAASLSTSGAEPRRDAFMGLSQYVSEQALCVPLVFERDVSAYTKQVHGYRANLMAKHNFEGVWLAQS